ncbi:uncharacterized protein [Bemisia tabaci]|uniref:uncharacterized protein isoform X3 n=1 Tax=Bemisia tabaci TaxID=7038 RepID=UPI003B28B608
MSNPPAANNQQLAPGHGTSPLHVINYPLTPIFNQTSPGPSQLPPVRQTLRLEGMDFWKNHLLYAFEAACAGKSMEDIAVIATAAAATVAREAVLQNSERLITVSARRKYHEFDSQLLHCK